MTLEESLRRDLELVTRALGLVERIPAEPTEPHDLLSREWPEFGPDAQAWQDFLMGTPKEDSGRSPRAWDQLSSILSSFRIHQGRSDLEMIHTGLLHVAGWLNRPMHKNWRRRLIALLEDAADHLRLRLKRECGAEAVTRRGQRGSRRLRTITARADLDAFQERAMELLAANQGRDPIKGSAIAAHCGVALGTSKRGLSELVRCGCLTSGRRGYVFVRWPEASEPEREP